jgi:hypothetical protein
MLVIEMARVPSEVSRYLAKIGRKGGSVSGESLESPKGFAVDGAGATASRARWGDLPRCPCGEMTEKRAKARGHKCQAAK